MIRPKPKYCNQTNKPSDGLKPKNFYSLSNVCAKRNHLVGIALVNCSFVDVAWLWIVIRIVFLRVPGHATRFKSMSSFSTDGAEKNSGKGTAAFSSLESTSAPPNKKSKPNYFSKLLTNAVSRVQTSTVEGGNFGRAAMQSGGSADKSSGGTSGAYVASIVGSVFGVGIGLVKAGLGVPLDITRERSRGKFMKGLEEWAPREMDRITQAPPAFADKRCVRVVAIRHGHGYHNDLGGLMSPLSRDPWLTSLGREEAHLSCNVLKEVPFSLAVVSPFTRTLETASIILGADRAKNLPTVLQPLAAEHNGGKWNDDDLNAATSYVARGDHGSPMEELNKRFPSNDFPQYGGFNELPNKWWHYGQEGGFESHASFTSRAKALREYLGSLNESDLVARKKGSGEHPPIIALVSHGGILSKAFGGKGSAKKFKNCEFRVFDIAADGAFRRPQGTQFEPQVASEGSESTNKASEGPEGAAEKR